MKLKLITLMLLLIMLIVPVLADDNPFDNIIVNATQEVPVTNVTHVNLTQPDISGHYDYVDISGNTLTSHFGRLVFSSTPYIVRRGAVINSVAQISARDQLKPDQKISGNELTTSYSSGDSIKNLFYRSLIKENITLNSPVQEIGYNYQCYLLNWTTKEPSVQFNNTTFMNETVYRNVTCFSNDSTVSIDLDQWGNAVVYINGANTLVLPVPTAIDAAGNGYTLSWELDKQNNVLKIGNLNRLLNASFPVKVDPTELVTNWGFETGNLSGWSTFYDGRYPEYFTPSVITYAHSGTYCVHSYYTNWNFYEDYYGNTGIYQYINCSSPSSFYAYEYIRHAQWDWGLWSTLSYGNAATSNTNDSWSLLTINPTSTGTNLLRVSGQGYSMYNYHGPEFDLNFDWFCDDVSSTGQTSPVVANFTASPQSGNAPLTVQFNNTSTGNPTSWLWNFGDGSNNTTKNPVHTYNQPGNYTVTLTASNAAGSNTTAKINYISVFTVPVANFTASPTSGNAPLVVQFTDISTNSPTSWQWDFGDGNTSTLQNPVHMYSQSGNYTISLTASNAAGSNTTTNNNYINVIWVPYVYNGIYWHQGYAQYYPNSTILSSWIPSLDTAADTWSNVDTNFYFSENSSSSNELYYAELGSDGPIASTSWWPPYGDSMSAAWTTFNANKNFSTSEASDCFDVQSVAVHEFGHWLSLGHSSDSQAVMYPYLSKGQLKRDLYWDDTMGIVYIYGGDKLIKNKGSESITNKSMTISTSSLLEAYTHEDLSNHSDTIVQGTVKEILPSKWNTIDGKQPNKPLTKLIPGVDVIYNDNIIKVDKYLKNPQSSKEVIVRTFGGTVGNVTIKSEDDPSFEPGEKVLLYLSKDTSPYTDNIGPDHFMVTGLLQGKYKLTNDGKASRFDETISQGELLSTI